MSAVCFRSATAGSAVSPCWGTYDEDTLVIDIVDPASGQVLWSGAGAGNTRGGGDDADRHLRSSHSPVTREFGDDA